MTGLDDRDQANVDAMMEALGGIWDSALRLLNQAHKDGVLPEPAPKPWAEQPEQVRLAFIIKSGDHPFELHNMINDLGERWGATDEGPGSLTQAPRSP